MFQMSQPLKRSSHKHRHKNLPARRYTVLSCCCFFQYYQVIDHIDVVRKTLAYLYYTIRTWVLMSWRARYSGHQQVNLLSRMNMPQESYKRRSKQNAKQMQFIFRCPCLWRFHRACTQNRPIISDHSVSFIEHNQMACSRGPAGGTVQVRSAAVLAQLLFPTQFRARLAGPGFIQLDDT